MSFFSSCFNFFSAIEKRAHEGIQIDDSVNHDDMKSYANDCIKRVMFLARDYNSRKGKLYSRDSHFTGCN